MAILKTCCCMNNVRSGSLACGIYTLVLALINGGIIGFNLNFLNKHNLVEYYQETKGWFLATLVVCSLLLVSSIVLIIGVQRDNRTLIMPWVFVTIIMIAMDTAALIYECLSFGHLTLSIVQMVIWLGFSLLNVYCILCVISQYQELSAGRGTLRFRRQQEFSRILYRPHIQEVHITQGPIVMQCPQGGVITSTIQQNPGSVTASVFLQPPEYNVAMMSLPKYCSSVNQPTTTASVTSSQPQSEPLLDKSKPESPPPPYSP